MGGGGEGELSYLSKQASVHDNARGAVIVQPAPIAATLIGVHVDAASNVRGVVHQIYPLVQLPGIHSCNGSGPKTSSGNTRAQLTGPPHSSVNAGHAINNNEQFALFVVRRTEERLPGCNNKSPDVQYGWVGRGGGGGSCRWLCT